MANVFINITTAQQDSVRMKEDMKRGTAEPLNARNKRWRAWRTFRHCCCCLRHMSLNNNKTLLCCTVAFFPISLHATAHIVARAYPDIRVRKCSCVHNHTHELEQIFATLQRGIKPRPRAHTNNKNIITIALGVMCTANHGRAVLEKKFFDGKVGVLIFLFALAPKKFLFQLRILLLLLLGRVAHRVEKKSLWNATRTYVQIISAHTVQCTMCLWRVRTAPPHCQSARRRRRLHCSVVVVVVKWLQASVVPQRGCVIFHPNWLQNPPNLSDVNNS